MAGLNCPTGRQSTLKLLLWKINKERNTFLLYSERKKNRKLFNYIGPALGLKH